LIKLFWTIKLSLHVRKKLDSRVYGSQHDFEYIKSETKVDSLRFRVNV